nr:hypothetical protein [Tanacetum cinerariifolium]
MADPLPLLEKLGRATDSNVMKDQLIILFERELAEDAEKITEFCRLFSNLRTFVKRRDGYIVELRLYKSCDDTLGTIEMFRRMQLDNMEKVKRKRYEEIPVCAPEMLIILFERELAEDAEKITEFCRLFSNLRTFVRRRDGYIVELRLYRSCDDTLGTIEMFRRMHLDNMEKVDRLLLMAKET